jgi:hypothetical protein
MSSRTELLAYMGAALATVVGLFALQIWYASYVDVSVVHGSLHEVPDNPELVKMRERDRAKLSGGKLPIDAAKQTLAERGRQASAVITPRPSDDLSAMSGWVYRPGFKPYEPRGRSAGEDRADGSSGSSAPSAGGAPSATAPVQVSP